MPDHQLDFLFLGPAPPFRGGIAETQYELAKHLLDNDKKVALFSFSKLYPKLLFPGKKQKISGTLNPSLIDTTANIHAYHPLKWNKVVRQVNELNPRYLIFRYYTPFLAPVYGWLAKKINQHIIKIALVDNWTPHEKTPLDSILNRYFGKKMNAFSTFSKAVALQIKKDFKLPLWQGYHPINTHLPKPISKLEARKKLGWDSQQKIVLFFGLIRQYKGLELLIAAFAKNPLNETNIILKVVGECYEDPKKYTDLVQRLGLQSKVEFDFKYQSLNQVQYVFSACDLVAQTYHTATQSGVTPMAYFYNKPLLVSDIEGLNTPIRNDQTGVCVKKDPKKIALGIEDLLKSENYRRIQNNLKKSLPSYQWDNWIKEWSHFILSLEH